MVYCVGGRFRRITIRKRRLISDVGFHWGIAKDRMEFEVDVHNDTQIVWDGDLIQYDDHSSIL